MAIIVLYIVVFFVQFAFLVRNYFKMILHVWEDKPYKNDGISLLIACKDDALKLEPNLHLFLEQQHPHFEVIVVDDASTIPMHIEANPRLKVIRLEEGLGKRNALAQGVHIAQYKYLLFSDADCVPSSKFWAGEMLSNAQEGIDIVLGYGAYKTPKSVLGNLIQLDTLYTVANYMSAALRNKAYMGVGRNLLMKKEVFEQAILKLKDSPNIYGDDDLLVQNMAQKGNVALCLHPRGFVYSEAPKNFSEWSKQKTRHVSAGHFYKKSVLFELGLERLSLWLFYMFSALLLFSDLQFLACVSLGFYWLYKIYIFSKLKERYQSSLQVMFLPIWDLFYSISLFKFTITSIFAATKRWR